MKLMLVMAFLLSAVPILGQPSTEFVDEELFEWVSKNSPYGFDVTIDGTIWVNIYKVGQPDDLAIRAEDLRKARETGNQRPSFWVRGYHKANAKVRYRESKVLLSIDCQTNTIGASTRAYYDASGDLMFRVGAQPHDYIIPGSIGEQYHKLICTR